VVDLPYKFEWAHSQRLAGIFNNTARYSPLIILI
jgi:hypothetical protein